MLTKDGYSRQALQSTQTGEAGPVTPDSLQAGSENDNGPELEHRGG